MTLVESHQVRRFPARSADLNDLAPAPWLSHSASVHERGILGSTIYSRVWEEARQLAFTCAQAASPLAGRPYELRHAALTAGIAPTKIAKRAGNSVEVLLRRFAGCLDNQAESINRRIEQALDDSALEIEPDA